MTVRELENRMSSHELTEWQAYENISGPLGLERLDILAAHIACTIANANSTKRYKLKEFVPQWDDQRATSDDEMLTRAYALNAAFGGTVEGTR